jgi:hypothetical protein
MDRPLRWPLTAIFAVVAGVSLVAAELSNYDPAETGQQVLTTLASVQAAVFAIVFSVVVLGIQLSTSRYSARLADLFRSDSAYKKTVGIFAGSLGIDIAALLLFHYLGTYALRLMVFLAVGLSAASFVVLYFFVDRTLEQTTPEGIIKRVKQELTPRQIVEDVEAADNDPSETDPFLVPVSIVRSAIDDRDVPAATRGLNVIDNQVGELLKFVYTDQVEEDTPVGNSLEELSTNRLPSAGEKTVDENLGEAGSETVDTISSIGSNAVKQGHEPVAIHSSQGLGKLVASVDFNATGERIRKEAIDESTEILDEAADAGLWDATGTGIRTLGWRAAQSVVQRDPTESYNRPYNTLALSQIPSILEKVVEGVPSDVSEADILEGLTLRDGEHASPPEEWALWCCYAAMAEVTSAFIRYELSHGEEIVKWNRAGNGWTKCISVLDNSEFDSLLRYWLGTLLYLEYIQFSTDNQYMEDFHSSARFDVSRDALMQTIDDILDSQFDPRSRIDLLPGQFNPIERPRTGHSAPPVTNANRTFEEWLEHQKKITPDDTGGWGVDEEIIEKIDEEEDVDERTDEEAEDETEDNDGSEEGDTSS